ncbi:UDP-3-O-(3-hydroxymyristoyl)glucosamine N-acyltransferase [Lentisphaerota bacterium ZTH]|nr:UDP-3-O-(3-hydroxymyristoyl)glucosamine N-acyltransferase [Lentisphaerota bacterium]WET06775.1 UDP-3-O-(3-hydroxymyristoyl)glucosamine N-acyltransferase [Lentisphaerota bacterium ZTH]
MKQITAGQIAEAVNGSVIGNAELAVSGVASLMEASPSQASFVGNKRYLKQLADSAAGIILVEKKLEKQLNADRTFVLCENVDYSFSKVIAFFAPEPVTYAPGIHPSAVVAESAKIADGVYIGANAVVDENAEIGPGTSIGAGSFVGQEVKIGAQCQISPNVTIMHRCTVGHKAILHPGVVIGGDGFGFVPGPQGLVKVPQTGIVQIDDDVEIGANTTIDRARFGRTWIKSNVKIDNQVMVAHNVEVGESTILVGQSGIAGSAKLGRGVIIAAQAGVNGHITLGDGVQVAGTSGVVKSLPAGFIALGTPAESQREYMNRRTLPKKFEKLSRKVEDLKAEVEELKK